MNAKEIAGRRAAEFVEDDMTVGLGTGSTVWFTLVRLAERVRTEGLRVRGVPTSVDTEKKARELGIPLVALDEVERLDLTIDGADEIDPEFQMIKGGGGALLREKVVAFASDREVIVIGRNKWVERLGTSFDLPVEIISFAQSQVVRSIQRLGGQARLRRAATGVPFITDNGNSILDVHFEHGIADPRRLELDLDSIPGIVETGLFIDLAQVAVIGGDDGFCEVREKHARAGKH